MFDTVAGLPVHVLVVHGAVVLLPLAGLATVLVAAVPSWRRARGWMVLVDAAVLGLAVVAKESGETLQLRLSQATGSPVAVDHAELGELLPWFALGLLVTAALAFLVRRRGAVLVGLAALLTVVAAGASAYWTFQVGHSGAESVWKDQIAATRPVGG